MTKPVGMVSKEEKALLATLAKDATMIVEIGSYHGLSTTVLADNSPGLVIAIDPHDGRTGLAPSWAAFGEAATGRRILAFKGSSEDAAAALTPLLARRPDIDLLFIDGDHSFEAVGRDLALWVPRVRVGGVVALHDYGEHSYPGVKRAADAVVATGLLTPRASAGSLSAFTKEAL